MFVNWGRKGTRISFANASIWCTALGGEHNKDSYPGLGSIEFVTVHARNNWKVGSGLFWVIRIQIRILKTGSADPDRIRKKMDRIRNTGFYIPKIRILTLHREFFRNLYGKVLFIKPWLRIILKSHY